MERGSMLFHGRYLALDADCGTRSSNKMNFRLCHLICQAARLLGQVLHYLSNGETRDDIVWMQLDRTLHLMLAVAKGYRVSAEEREGDLLKDTKDTKVDWKLDWTVG